MTLGVRTVQPALMVADFEAKRAAQLCGLGVGALPRYLIADDIEAGRLIQTLREAVLRNHPIGVAVGEQG